MGCGTSAPSRVVQPAVVGPPSTVPHHPEANPAELYKIVSRKPDRIRTVSPRSKDLKSPQSGELPSFAPVDAKATAEPENGANNLRLRSLDSELECMWDASTSASTAVGRLPRHALASLLRTVFEYLPPTVQTLKISDCEEALGKAFRQFPAFMPEDANGNIASPPKSSNNEENAKKDMRAWIMATSFDRPATPIGHCTKEPSPFVRAVNDTYLHYKARINDHLYKEDPVPEKAKAEKEKPDSSSEGGQKQAKRTPPIASPRVGSTQKGSKQGSRQEGDHSPIQLSPTRRKPHANGTVTSPAHNNNNDNTASLSFLDRDTIRLSHDVQLEECDISDIGSAAPPSAGASSLSPSVMGLMDTVSHGGVSSTAGRPSSPTRTLRAIQSHRAMRDVGLSRNKRKLFERVSSWIELVILTLFEDSMNNSSPTMQTTRTISQTAAPLSAANLASLQSQLNALRSRAAATTLHPSPDNEDFFMNVPSAICWYYGAEPFHPPDPNTVPSTLTQLLPPCVLRYPYNNVYGFAIAKSADITRKAVHKLSMLVAKDSEPL